MNLLYIKQKKSYFIFVVCKNVIVSGQIVGQTTDNNYYYVFFIFQRIQSDIKKNQNLTRLKPIDLIFYGK